MPEGSTGLAKVCIANVNLCTGRLSKDRYLDFGSAKIQNSIVAWKVETPISNQHCSFCSKLQFTTGLLPENPPTVFVWIARFAFLGPEKFEVLR